MPTHIHTTCSIDAAAYKLSLPSEPNCWIHCWVPAPSYRASHASSLPALDTPSMPPVFPPTKKPPASLMRPPLHRHWRPFRVDLSRSGCRCCQRVQAMHRTRRHWCRRGCPASSPRKHTPHVPFAVMKSALSRTLVPSCADQVVGSRWGAGIVTCEEDVSAANQRSTPDCHRCVHRDRIRPYHPMRQRRSCPSRWTLVAQSIAGSVDLHRECAHDTGAGSG